MLMTVPREFEDYEKITSDGDIERLQKIIPFPTDLTAATGRQGVVFSAENDTHITMFGELNSNLLDSENITQTRSEFIRSVDTIDWSSKSASFFKEGIKHVLSADAVQLARELSQLAVQIHPHDEDIIHLNKVISPPQIVRGRKTTESDITPTMEWLKNNAQDYRGNWIAVQSGKLIGMAKSHQALLEKLGDVPQNDVLITEISE